MSMRFSRVVLLSPALISTVVASTYYVASNGNDSNPGTLTAPFATVNKGASLAKPADTVYIRGGIYYQTASISNSGTSSSPITIAGYPGETAIIDGQDTLPSSTGSALVNVTGSYVTVKDLTVTNSHGVGARLQGNYGTLLRIKANHNYTSGLYITGGSYNVIDSCEVYYNSTKNEYGASTSGWGSGLSSARNGVNHSILRRNKVWNNWGEGLSTFESRYDTLEDNIVWDNYSTEIYISDTNYSVCQRNLVYTTPNNPLAGYNGSQEGIMMGDEVYSSTAPSSDNRIINNFVMGGYRPFLFWGSNSGGGFVRELIADNTFVANATTGAEPIKIHNTTLSSGSYFQNNIVLGNPNSSYAMATIYTTTGVTFSHNLWSKTPPSIAAGAGDVIGDPMLAETGSTAAGSLTPDWFKLLSSSPGINKALALSTVPDDFFDTLRDSTPDIGGDQYVSSTSSSDTQAPSVPTGLTATATSASTVALSWMPSTDNVAVAGYKIYRNGAPLTTVGSTSFSDTGLAPSTAYSYTVSAYDASGNSSAQSSSASVITQADTQAPSVPIGLSAAAVSSSQITLAWSASSDNVGVAGYRVYRGGTQLASVSGTSYQDTGLTPSTTYTYTVSSYDATGNMSAQSPPATATTPTLTATGQAVTSFTLINADTDQPIATLNNGAVLNLAALPTRNLNVRANTSPSVVGSVVFIYDGKTEPMQNTAPYAAFDDNNGNYYAWTPTVGSHVLKATPYTRANAAGTAGAALTVSFTVTDSQAVMSFTLINADTDLPIGVLNNKAVLSLSALPTRNLNVRADTSPSVVGSVVFLYDGKTEPMQNSAPYAAFDDANGNYYAWTPTIGSHVLTATPYTGSNASGSAGVSLTLTFTVTN